MILLVGANGSMGKRYRAILKQLGQSYYPVDIGQMCNDVTSIKGSIIATPTETHYSIIKKVAPYGPILCEKPVCKSLSDLNDTVDFIRDNGVSFTMMNQYKLLDEQFAIGHSSYDYYNTGKDGLAWDCMQIIGAARSTVSIKDSSPIWECKLNGRQISIANMDRAYVEFVEEWLTFKKMQSLDYITEMHYKAKEYEASN